ncbi:MAG TPA: hypothetical protein VGJ86_17820, partial [Acidimicrobiales bacterium]
MRRHSIAAALLVAGMALGPIAPAGAESAAPTLPVTPTALDGGLQAETASVFVVDPATTSVHVTSNITLTSQDSRSGYYFYQYGVPVLETATNLAAARGDGASLSVGVETGEEGFYNFAVINLKPTLFYGDSLSFTLTYDLPSQPPRSPSGVRVTDAFVGLPVFVPGDPGMASVEIRLPDTYDVDVGGQDVRRDAQPGEIVLTNDAIEDPSRFSVLVVGSNEDSLASREVDVADTQVEIRAWPDDPEWAEFAARYVGAAVPLLVDMIGQEWPDRVLDIVETQAPYAHGYAGWYDPSEHAISITDQLDQQVMVHEMSHIWFNSELFHERWLNEGFAEDYSHRVLEAMGEPQEPPPATDRAGEGAVALNDWEDEFAIDENNQAVSDYGYATSQFVVNQLTNDVGVDGMKQVFASIVGRDITYVGDPRPETMSGVGNWQRLLDLLEEQLGSQQAGQIFDTWVVNDEQRGLLAQRAEARTAYAGLKERGGEWTPPLEVRKYMSEWGFEYVTDSIAQATGVLDMRDQALAALEGTSADHLALEDEYETARDIQRIEPLAKDTVRAAEAYRGAEKRHDDGSGSILATVGLLGSDMDGQLDDARSALEDGDPNDSIDASDGLEQRYDDAARTGALRIGGVSGLGAGLGFGIYGARRWRKRRATKRSAAEAAAAASQSFIPGFGGMPRQPWMTRAPGSIPPPPPPPPPP